MAVGDLEIWDKKGHFESPGRSCCFFAEQIYPRVILLPIESVVWYVMSPHAFCITAFGVKCMDRSLAVGATGGSVSALILKLLAGFIASEPSFDCPVCPSCLENFQLDQIDLVSCLIGVVLGLSLGPFLDVVYLLRQSWRVWLRTRVAALEKTERTEPYYKLL